MKVSALVGVLDDKELIGMCLKQLISIGIDSIIVQDYGSTDGTQEAVQQFASEDIVLRHYSQTTNHTGSDWGHHEVTLARTTGADWVIFLDADELLLTSTGSIHSALEQVEVDSLKVARYNVPVSRHGPLLPNRITLADYSNIYLYTRPPCNWRDRLDSQKDPCSWISGVPVPKVAAKIASVSSLGHGAHSAFYASGSPASSMFSQKMVIAHLPFTTNSRFRDKVENIAESLEVQSEYHQGDVAWHWRTWVALSRAGQIEAEFSKQLIDPGDIDFLVEEGRLSSVANLFSKYIQAAQPLST